MKKQYINSSNSHPTALLSAPWMLVLTTKVFDWPTWVYGIAGTLAFLFLSTYIYRTVTEEGVDVVKRD